jgi:hypothetical protein
MFLLFIITIIHCHRYLIVVNVIVMFVLAELMQVYEAARWTISQMNQAGNSFTGGISFGEC